jgi:hypothetical protein
LLSLTFQPSYTVFQSSRLLPGGANIVTLSVFPVARVLNGASMRWVSDS